VTAEEGKTLGEPFDWHSDFWAIENAPEGCDLFWGI